MRIIIEIDETGRTTPQVQIPVAESVAPAQATGALDAGPAPAALGAAPTAVAETLAAISPSVPSGVSAGPAPF